MNRATPILRVFVVFVVATSGCALRDAGAFGPDAATARDALRACGVEATLPACVSPESPDALPAWERFGVSPDELTCIEEINCAARDLDDDTVARNTRARVFVCLDTLDEPLPTGQEAEACLERCQSNLDFFSCAAAELEDDGLLGDLDEHDGCVDGCR